MDDYTVNLTLTKKQTYILRSALDSFARMTAGQLEIALEGKYVR